MNLDALNKVCFTICILCIVAGTVLTLLMIWAELHDNEVVWKCWLTIATFFGAGALTLAVTKSLAWHRRDRD